MCRFIGIFPVNIPKNVSFIEPLKKTNRVGGVKTPPYEMMQ